VRHRQDLATRTRISVSKSPFPSAGTAVSLFRAKTVQQRPLLPREVETRLPDCGVTQWVRIDHLSRLPVMPPSTYDVNCNCIVVKRLDRTSFLVVRVGLGLGWRFGLVVTRWPRTT